jgi:acyl-coenzyme A thioesterase PaaI-like protein
MTSPVSYETIRTQLAASAPFAALVGVEVVEVGLGTATARLSLRDEISTHVASLHAGALFTLGETASGAAMAGAFAARLAGLRPLATGAAIAYRRIARGEIVARASIASPVDALLDRLDADGKVAFEAAVVLSTEDGAEVAEMTVGWRVAKR